MSVIDAINKILPTSFHGLSSAENLMLESAVCGRLIRIESTSPADTGGASGANHSLHIRAEILKWLLTSHEASEYIHARGVQVQGGILIGILDLEGMKLSCPLTLIGCQIEDDIVLQGAKTYGIRLSGSQARNIFADNMTCVGSVQLDQGFHSIGEITLHNSRIEGNLVCDGAIFENADGRTLFADRIHVIGGAFLRDGFHSIGELRLLEGIIEKGSLVCDGSRFENPGGIAILADRLRTRGDILLRDGFTAEGEVSLLECEIGGSLSCKGSAFENPRGRSLSADRMRCSGSVFFNGSSLFHVGKLNLSCPAMR